MTTVSDVTSICRRTCLIAAAVVLVVGCERPEPGGTSASTTAPTTASTVGTTTPSTSAPPSTTAPAETTVPATSAPATSAPATTAPPTTTPPPTTAPQTTAAPDPTTADDLVLAFDGVRPLVFGDVDTHVVAALVAVLDEPISDDLTEYPTPDNGRFVNESLEEAFVSPFGRAVCFSNRLCAQFGAGSATALQFIGWRFEGDGAAGLATEDGITVGSRWGDHVAVIVADQGGCFSVGYGSADGVDVIMQSDGEPFVVVIDGEFEAGAPDPADVTIIELSAGDLPIQLFADC